MDGLPIVAKLSIPRWYGFPASAQLDLHTFSDASKVGFGTVAYLKAEGHRAAFVAAKTRVVPPSKCENVPRLELQAALISLRLVKTILGELSTANIRKIFIWIDSETVLRWLYNDDVRYEAFVNNRVSEIRDILANIPVPVELRYVPTKLNPADLASRGLERGAQGFVEDFDFWTHGPDYLNDPDEEWPINIKLKSAHPSTIQQRIEAALTAYALSAVIKPVEDPLSSQDNWLEHLASQCDGPEPTAEEITEIELRLIRAAQEEYFSPEISSCRKAANRVIIRRKGPFMRRQLWLDSDNILRLQLRVFESEDWPIGRWTPIVMPKGHPVTQLLMRDAHRQVEHQGSAYTFSKLRERFYVPLGLAIIKKICQQCVFCLTRKPRPMRAPTAPLHGSRLRSNLPPWTESGMDHFGPFELTGKQKRWGLIFICLTTRAIHLEDVDGLGAEPFLKALDRFINRCGRPEDLRSDMGTSFINLAKQQDKTAKEYAEEIRQRVLLKYRINLHFNPAGAPHWGGSWERMIKEVKKILKSTFQATGKWKPDEFRTFLVRAEGIINRRPIAFGDDGELITPNNFVQPGASLPIGPPLGAPSFKSLQQVKEAEELFWKQWNKYYLPSVSVEQVLGDVRVDVLLPGDKVLLREGNNPLVDIWTPATVVEVYPSKDGIIRSAMVEYKGGKVVRDITRLSIIDGPVLERKMALPAGGPKHGVNGPSGGMFGRGPVTRSQTSIPKNASSKP